MVLGRLYLKKKETSNIIYLYIYYNYLILTERKFFCVCNFITFAIALKNIYV